MYLLQLKSRSNCSTQQDYVNRSGQQGMRPATRQEKTQGRNGDATCRVSGEQVGTVFRSLPNWASLWEVYAGKLTHCLQAVLRQCRFNELLMRAHPDQVYTNQNLSPEKTYKKKQGQSPIRSPPPTHASTVRTTERRKLRKKKKRPGSGWFLLTTSLCLSLPVESTGN